MRLEDPKFYSLESQAAHEPIGQLLAAKLVVPFFGFNREMGSAQNFAKCVQALRLEQGPNHVSIRNCIRFATPHDKVSAVSMVLLYDVVRVTCPILARPKTSAVRVET